MSLSDAVTCNCILFLQNIIKLAKPFSNKNYVLFLPAAVQEVGGAGPASQIVWSTSLTFGSPPLPRGTTVGSALIMRGTTPPQVGL